MILIDFHVGAGRLLPDSDSDMRMSSSSLGFYSFLAFAKDWISDQKCDAPHSPLPPPIVDSS